MTDHVKNQLCVRIEELEAEKMELNEQLDALQKERDALAAHLERILSEWNSGDDLFSDEWINRVGDIVEDAPETSLARLKAEWQSEALEQLAADSFVFDAEELRDRASELRRQAEGGEV